MTAKPFATSPEAKFAALLDAKLKELLRPRPFVVPQLSADPPETDPTNLWMRNDGRLRGRYKNSGGTYTYMDYPIRNDITSPPALPANPSPPAPSPAPQTYRTVWTGTWSQTYLAGSGAKRTDVTGETMLVYGKNPDDTLGQQRSFLGFDYANIVSTLASTTIQSVQLTLTNLGSYWPTVDVFFGLHNFTAEPTQAYGSDIQLRRSADAVLGIGTSTVDLPLAFAQALRAGTSKGIAIDAPSDERTFYGYAAGVGSGYTAPQLTVTYAK